MKKVSEKSVVTSLKKSLDPELGLDVYTLGLVYKIEIGKEIVSILMTLTSPMCPYGPILMEDVKEKVKSVPGVKEVKVELTFEPPWQPSDEVKAMLGIL